MMVIVSGATTATHYQKANASRISTAGDARRLPSALLAFVMETVVAPKSKVLAASAAAALMVHVSGATVATH